MKIHPSVKPVTNPNTASDPLDMILGNSSRHSYTQSMLFPSLKFGHHRSSESAETRFNMVACMFCSPIDINGIKNYIKEHGPNVIINEDSGQTILQFAESVNNSEIVTFCLANGANVNAQDKFGQTVLFTAAKFTKNPQIVRELVLAGADPYIADKDGNTPLKNVNLLFSYSQTKPEIILAINNALQERCTKLFHTINDTKDSEIHLPKEVATIVCNYFHMSSQSSSHPD